MKLILRTAAALALSALLTSCANKDKLTVGSIIFDGTNEWFIEALEGIRTAAQDLNVALSEADSHYDVGVEKDLVREQIKNKANALVVCPLTTEESGAMLKEAISLNIPVVTWNSVVTPAPTSQIVVDSTQLGSATGEYLAEYVKKHGITSLKAALIVDQSFSIGVERCDGFKKSIQPLVDSGVLEVVYETRGNLLEETKIVVSKLLDERPDVNFIWCWHQMSLMATIEVLKERHRSDILVAGTDMSVALANDMLGDEVQLIAVTTQQPYEMGYAAVMNAVKAARGESVEKTVVIPVLTYTKDDSDGLKKYVSEHAQFLKK